MDMEAKSNTEQQSHMQLVIKDLTAGTIAGIANVLSGHPLDTMKVRMQMLKTSFTACIKDIAAKEGIKAFYKGVTSPLYSVPAINALVFGAYELGKRFLATDSEMTINKVFLAGAWTGIVCSVIFTPVELIKCRQQMEGVGSKIKTTTTLAMMKQVLQKEGIRGLYKGNLIALLALTPSYSTQFGSYELAKGALSSKIKDTQMINLISGGIAGLACWVVCYPQDVMKTKIQCDVGPNGGKYTSHRYIPDGGIINCAKDIYRHEGFYGFWKGFSACTVRAIVANACMFVAYEEAQIFLNSGSSSF